MTLKETRPVGFKTVLGLLKQKRTNFSLGIIFTLLPVAMGIMFLLITRLIDSDIPDADYTAVSNKGRLTTATITDIETQSNITINSEHPSIISYTYMDGNNKENGVYRSLDPDRIIRMDIGDTIQIKYLGDSSMIVGLDPFEFPFNLVFNILIPMLVVGIAMLTLLYFRIRSELNLYKHGEVKDAEVVSMTSKAGRQGFTVHYQYKSTLGQRILAESFTNDYAILNGKKQGDTIKIFVSTDDESKSCLIPKLEQIRNNWKVD
jgi:hypothetical protein